MFIGQISGGLASGALYGLLALAIVLVFRVSQVANFAQGDMAMVSTFVAYGAIGAGLPLWAGLLVGLAFAAALGAAVYALIVWPMRNADPMMVTIATLGLQIVMNAVAVRLWANNQPYRFPPVVAAASVRLGGLDVPTSSLIVLVATLVAVGLLWSFFSFTRAGLVLRTVAQNPMVARLCGIRVGRGVAYAWVISSMVGALAGMLFAPTVFLATFMMDPLQLRSFTAAVLGGMTSWPGVVVGGIGFGALENLGSAYISNELQPAIAYLVIVAVLLVRPAGLFGKFYRGRV